MSSTPFSPALTKPAGSQQQLRPQKIGNFVQRHGRALNASSSGLQSPTTPQQPQQKQQQQQYSASSLSYPGDQQHHHSKVFVVGVVGWNRGAVLSFSEAIAQIHERCETLRLPLTSFEACQENEGEVDGGEEDVEGWILHTADTGTMWVFLCPAREYEMSDAVVGDWCGGEIGEPGAAVREGETFWRIARSLFVACPWIIAVTRSERELQSRTAQAFRRLATSPPAGEGGDIRVVGGGAKVSRVGNQYHHQQQQQQNKQQQQSPRHLKHQLKQQRQQYQSQKQTQAQRQKQHKRQGEIPDSEMGGECRRFLPLVTVFVWGHEGQGVGQQERGCDGERIVGAIRKAVAPFPPQFLRFEKDMSLVSSAEAARRGPRGFRVTAANRSGRNAQANWYKEGNKEDGDSDYGDERWCGSSTLTALLMGSISLDEAEAAVAKTEAVGQWAAAAAATVRERQTGAAGRMQASAVASSVESWVAYWRALLKKSNVAEGASGAATGRGKGSGRARGRVKGRARGEGRGRGGVILAGDSNGGAAAVLSRALDIYLMNLQGSEGWGEWTGLGGGAWRASDGSWVFGADEHARRMRIAEAELLRGLTGGLGMRAIPGGRMGARAHAAESGGFDGDTGLQFAALRRECESLWVKKHRGCEVTSVCGRRCRIRWEPEGGAAGKVACIDGMGPGGVGLRGAEDEGSSHRHESGWTRTMACTCGRETGSTSGKDSTVVVDGFDFSAARNAALNNCRCFTSSPGGDEGLVGKQLGWAVVVMSREESSASNGEEPTVEDLSTIQNDVMAATVSVAVGRTRVRGHGGVTVGDAGGEGGRAIVTSCNDGQSGGVQKVGHNGGIASGSALQSITVSTAAAKAAATTTTVASAAAQMWCGWAVSCWPLCTNTFEASLPSDPATVAPSPLPGSQSAAAAAAATATISRFSSGLAAGHDVGAVMRVASGRRGVMSTGGGGGSREAESGVEEAAWVMFEYECVCGHRFAVAPETQWCVARGVDRLANKMVPMVANCSVCCSALDGEGSSNAAGAAGAYKIPAQLARICVWRPTPTVSTKASSSSTSAAAKAAEVEVRPVVVAVGWNGSCGVGGPATAGGTMIMKTESKAGGIGVVGSGRNVGDETQIIWECPVTVLVGRGEAVSMRLPATYNISHRRDCNHTSGADKIHGARGKAHEGLAFGSARGLAVIAESAISVHQSGSRTKIGKGS